MEKWSVRDDRPYIRPEESSPNWVPWIAIGVIAVAAAAYAIWQMRAELGWSLPEEAPVAQAAPEPAPAPAPAPEPAVRHPIPAPEAHAKALPSLEMSDSMMRESLVDLMGREAFAQLVLPVELVRRIVATVDNLPRQTAPRRVLPLKGVPGSFAVAAAGEEFTIAAENAKRYAPYVRVLALIDTDALVKTYVAAYPLFQKAYRELGYPGGNFNDRLMEAIDDMLAAPEIDAPVKLLRPKVLYEFADPDLETRSAGQKVLLRMGGENAALVKAKLREIRRALIAASQPKP